MTTGDMTPKSYRLPLLRHRRVLRVGGVLENIQNNYAGGGGGGDFEKSHTKVCYR